MENAGRLEKEIEASLRILKLEDDFDGEGSVSYTAEAWAKAVRVARYLVDNGFPVPRICPGPDGGIDLHWPDEENGFIKGLMYIHGDVISCYLEFEYFSLDVKGSTKK